MLDGETLETNCDSEPSIPHYVAAIVARKYIPYWRTLATTLTSTRPSFNHSLFTRSAKRTMYT